MQWKDRTNKYEIAAKALLAVTGMLFTGGAVGCFMVGLKSDELDWLERLVFLLFSLPSGIVGGVALAALWFSLCPSAADQASKANYPSAPWMWGKYQENIPLRDNLRGETIAPLVGLPFMLPFAATAILAAPRLWREDLYIFMPILVFALFPPVLLLKFISRLWKFYCYRNAELFLTDFPIVVGGPLRATLKVPNRRSIRDCYSFNLRCRVDYDGGGETRSRRLLWEDSQTRSPVLGDLEFLHVAMDFAIPFDLPASGAVEGRPDLGADAKAVWSLKMACPANHPPFDTELELQVFKIGASRELTHADQVEETEALETLHHLATKNLHITERPEGGLEFYFAPPRQKSLAWMVTFFAILFVLIGVALAFSEIPQFFSIAFMVTSMILAHFAYRTWRAASRVIVAPGALRLIVGPNGRGEETLITTEEIDRLDVVRSGSVNEREFCDIVLFAKAGHRHTLAQWLDSEHQARRIIILIEKRIGMSGESE